MSSEGRKCRYPSQWKLYTVAMEDESVEAAFEVTNSIAKKLKELSALLKNQMLGGLCVRNYPKMNCP